MLDPSRLEAALATLGRLLSDRGLRYELVAIWIGGACRPRHSQSGLGGEVSTPLGSGWLCVNRPRRRGSESRGNLCLT